MSPEHQTFIRRVANGEIYTGVSGTAMAQWAVGWREGETEPNERPHDSGDFGRCMNVYWAAPDDLKPKMRAWLKKQLGQSGNDFDEPSFYGGSSGDWRWRR